MFDNIENIEIVSTFHKESKRFVKVENKKSHAFLFRIQGSMLYSFDEKNITLNEGWVIFIPKGTSYTANSLSDAGVYTSINFQADFKKEPHPVRYSLEGFYDAPFISNHFTDMWTLGTQAEKYKALSLFYSLLSYLSAIENASYAEKKKLKMIEPATNYLREHIYDCNLKAHSLHQFCKISDTYFRQIFISNFGMTPQSYITSKRMSYANSIILSGDFETIEEVARSVGYNDPLYFGKVFKKFYGVSPSELNKN